MFNLLSRLLLPLVLSTTVVGAPTIEADQGDFYPVKPPAIPLAVKSPYLSAWLKAGQNGGNGGYLAGSWPTHWTGRVLGWAGIIRVDGQVYQWMGNPGFPNVKQNRFEYTSTKSVFKLEVPGKIAIDVTFLSPITPDDLRRQSMTGSYMDVTVRSIDGVAHDVQLYSDISGEWASGESNVVVEWNTYKNISSPGGRLMIHGIQRQQQFEFDESDKPDGNGAANWGTIWYATQDLPGVLSVAASDRDSRQGFATNGRVLSNYDTKYRRINDNWPVMAFSRDLGRLRGDPVSTLFSIGIVQKNAISFLGRNGNYSVPSLWTSYLGTDPTSLPATFHWEHQAMKQISEALDRRVQSDSQVAGGSDLMTITTLTVRQAFAATQLVGTPSKPWLVMKEISSNGNTQTVDVVFPMHPILLYTNPTLLKLMLDPLFEQQEDGLWPHKFAIHDLGSHYPNFTGHADGQSEEMPVEECGNMIIMAAAYAKYSKDYGYLKKHYPLLKQWAQFLIEDSLIPDNQLSTDDFAGKLQNQTNLALKGIIGIRAMGLIAEYINDPSDRDFYNSFAQRYIGLWQTYGTAYSTLSHTTLNYGHDNTHGLLYNLWCDTELGFNFVPNSVYEMQSKFYPTVRNKYGVPLDTRHTWTKTDWLIFVAATTSRDTSQLLIGDIVKWLRENPTSVPFTDLYDTKTGDFPGIEFKARPVMGAAFAPILGRRY